MVHLGLGSRWKIVIKETKTNESLWLGFEIENLVSLFPMSKISSIHISIEILANNYCYHMILKWFFFQTTNLDPS